MQRDTNYVSTVSLNEVGLGELPGAHGNEREGTWSEVQSVALTPEAIASLGRFNVVKIDNPRRDCFKVRRFWVELELADGRRCSSMINSKIFTQPPSWRHAEGVGVPFGEQITSKIHFDLARE